MRVVEAGPDVEALDFKGEVVVEGGEVGHGGIIFNGGVWGGICRPKRAACEPLFTSSPQLGVNVVLDIPNLEILGIRFSFDRNE